MKMNVNRNVGNKIRSVRKQKKIKTAVLAKALNVSESEIRHLENGIRSVKEKHLSVIADTLNVSESFLVDRHINGYNDLIHILFEMEEITPIVLNENGLVFMDDVMQQMLAEWRKMYQGNQNGAISDDAYLEWKMNYVP